MNSPAGNRNNLKLRKKIVSPHRTPFFKLAQLNKKSPENPWKSPPSAKRQRKLQNARKTLNLT
jgi:hypothetical protein